MSFANADGASLEGDLVLVATGRTRSVQGLGLEELGSTSTPAVAVRVNDHGATNIPGLWAAGGADRTGLACSCRQSDGRVVVHNLTGRPDRMR